MGFQKIGENNKKKKKKVKWALSLSKWCVCVNGVLGLLKVGFVAKKNNLLRRRVVVKVVRERNRFRSGLGFVAFFFFFFFFFFKKNNASSNKVGPLGKDENRDHC
ncbi:unnamed protein product [Camellia sinensis]